MRRTLITGATGFIGRRIGRELSDDVYGLVRWSHGDLEPGAFSPVFGNLREYRDVERIVREIRPDVILHLGAISPVSESFDRPHEYAETNFLGTINVVEAALDHVPSLEKLVVAGTPEEYGNQPEYPTGPEAALRPRSPYGVSKVAATKYVRYAVEAFDLPAVISRHGNAFGRSDSTHFVVEAIVSKMLADQRPVRLGDPEPVREFLHIDDVIRAYQAMVDHGRPGQTYNFANEAVSIRELAEIARDITGYDGPIEWNTLPSRPSEIETIHLDDSLARRQLGWEPEVSIPEGIERVVEEVSKP